MAINTTKLVVVLCAVLVLFGVTTTTAAGNDGVNNYLDVETPNFFQYNSPLKQPDSLRSRPYYDFLSTLYRHDSAKSDLFRPYSRTARAAVLPAPVALTPATHPPRDFREKRAIVFRPLFVYKQQQIKKEQVKRH